MEETKMKPSIRMSLFALAAPALALGAVSGAAAQPANPAPTPPPMHAGPHWGEEREALLDAKLGGLKAGLRLNSEQEKLWGPFEAAVRNAVQLRMRHIIGLMHGPEGPGMMGPGGSEAGGPRRSPIDRLDAMADRMSEGAAALKQIVAAARPLYASLDDNQKLDFDFLSREMMMLGHGGMGWGHAGPAWGRPGPWPRHPGDWGPDEED
jgi:hypothetical protein